MGARLQQNETGAVAIADGNEGRRCWGRASDASGDRACDPSGIVRLILHETRTPLNAIRGFGELLLTGAGGALGGDALDYVQQIARAGRVLDDALEHLQELAALHRRRGPGVIASIELDGILAAEGFRTVFPTGRWPAAVMGDPGAWRRIAKLCRSYLTGGEPVPGHHLAARFARPAAGGLEVRLDDAGRGAGVDGTGLLAVELARQLAAADGAGLLRGGQGELALTWPPDRLVDGMHQGPATG